MGKFTLWVGQGRLQASCANDIQWLSAGWAWLLHLQPIPNAEYLKRYKQTAGTCIAKGRDAPISVTLAGELWGGPNQRCADRARTRGRGEGGEEPYWPRSGGGWEWDTQCPHIACQWRCKISSTDASDWTPHKPVKCCDWTSLIHLNLSNSVILILWETRG